jgi:alpha,alpha-trehalase
MLGLGENRDVETIQNMVDNFTDAINKYGHIPNGFRTYYLSRSQPPFFSLMVEMLAEMKDESIYAKYLPAMEREHAYWMEGAKDLKSGQAYKRVVRLKDGTYLNRYWDDLDIPRTESYADDVATVEKAVEAFQQTHTFKSEAMKNRAIDSLKSALYRHLRSAACSGWDFSNRWFSDGANLSSIETTDILPVDLNALMFKMEAVIMKTRKISGATKLDAGFFKRADFNAYFWNTKLNFYTDYHFVKNKKQSLISLAGMFPFCFALEDYKAQKLKATKAAEVLEAKLLKPGGLISVEKNTGQQWDAPNGWAPLQWMSVVGLERCGQEKLAQEIATRWMKINESVYQRTGKLMEKYNVEDMSLEAGGGEYPGQDGFGWTNGVYLAMKKKFAAVK